MLFRSAFGTVRASGSDVAIELAPVNDAPTLSGGTPLVVNEGGKMILTDIQPAK